MSAFPFPVLSAFTVRTGFDMCVGALVLPAGSEILMSAMTIKEMVNIAKHHGLVPIPLDIESGTLAPEIATIENAITERTRAIVIAHLFGTRMPMGPVIELRSEEHTSELQSPDHLVCRLLLEKKNKNLTDTIHTYIVYVLRTH